MPLYEYECDANGHRFEIIQKFSDPPVDKCPMCGSPVHKLQSAPAFQFKGTGWYVTDYAKKDKDGAKGTKPDTASKDTADKSERPAAASEKTEKSGDSKPASNTSPKSSGS